MPAVTTADGPVAVTGASGFIGAHTVIALLKRGYDVRGCVTDISNTTKTKFLLALNEEHPGNLTLHQANLLEEGSYDDVFAGYSAVLHVGTPMGYGGANNPVQVYEGAVGGIHNIVNSVKKAGTVRRLVYTSSFAAIANKVPPGYIYTEADWASDNREDDPNWNTDNLQEKGEIGYSMAKVECERTVYRLAEEDGSFDAISICPIVVLGPLLSPVHECVGSWQFHLGRTLAGKTNQRSWQTLWNIVDVRDCGEVQALIIESDVCKNGTRYQMSATDESGEISVKQLHEHLQALFPEVEVGGPPPEYDVMIEKYGKPYDAPRAHLDKAREELGLETHAVEDTLRTTGETMIALGLVETKPK